MAPDDLTHPDSAMTSQAQQAACDLLWDCWNAGRRLEHGLPQSCRPQTRAEGYAIQARLETRSAAPIFGWKIAATSPAGQVHIGVDGPLAGRLLAERVVEPPALVPFGANILRVAEAEFAFRMGRALPARAAAYTIDEVMAAVDSLHPAIEIPDSRYEHTAQVGAPQLIADNACAHYFVLGPATTADWRAIDLATHPVTATVSGKLQRQGVGGVVLGDPRIALTWLANELSAFGMSLQPGQVVTTGTCVIPLPIEPGDEVVNDMGVLGQVSMRFAAS